MRIRLATQRGHLKSRRKEWGAMVQWRDRAWTFWIVCNFNLFQSLVDGQDPWTTGLFAQLNVVSLSSLQLHMFELFISTRPSCPQVMISFSEVTLMKVPVVYFDSEVHWCWLSKKNFWLREVLKQEYSERSFPGSQSHYFCRESHDPTNRGKDL